MSERTLTTTVQSELERDTVLPALFVELLFDSGPLRLWSGLGNATINGETYTGTGTLGTISEIEESAGDVRASSVAMTLSGIPSSYLSIGLAEQFQGRPASIWLAFLDAAGAIMPDPIRVFKGRMDYPALEENGDTAKITVFAESHLIDLERPRIRRYTDEDQRELYPGDTGLRFITALQNKQVNWSNG